MLSLVLQPWPQQGISTRCGILKRARPAPRNCTLSLSAAPLFPPPPLAEPQPVRPPLAVPHDLKASDDGAHLRPRTSTLTSTIRQGDSATRDVSQTTTSPTTAQRRCRRRRPSSSLPRPAIATPLIPTTISRSLRLSLALSPAPCDRQPPLSSPTPLRPVRPDPPTLAYTTSHRPLSHTDRPSLTDL